VCLRELKQVLPVLVLRHRLGNLAQALRGDPAVAEGDALEAGDLEAGALLDDLHEGGGFGKAVVGAGVEPSEAAAEGLHLQLAVLQEFLVHGGDFQFTTRTRFDAFGYVHHLVGVEVEAHHGVVALGLLRLLLDAETVAVPVELGHTVALGIGHPVAEDGGLAVLLGILHRILQQGGEAVAVEDVVAQDEAGAIVTNELFPDDEGLRQSVGTGLLGILETHAVVGAVAQEAHEPRQVVGGADNQDVADAGQHQRGNRVIDHGLVIDGEQLLAHALGDGV